MRVYCCSLTACKGPVNRVIMSHSIGFSLYFSGATLRAVQQLPGKDGWVKFFLLLLTSSLYLTFGLEKPLEIIAFNPFDTVLWVF